MSASESAYTSLLQGVSQQLAKMRLPGQVTTQENMLSDTTTGPRRRPGARYLYSQSMAGETDSSIRAWDTDIAGAKVHIIVGTVTGRWLVLDSATSAVLGTGLAPYLVASSPMAIRATTVGSDFYMLNTGQLPYSVPPSSSVVPPTRRGFYFVKSGGFSKVFTADVTNNLGTVKLTYTTPDGTAAGDAAKAVPEYIVKQLVTGANATLLASIDVLAYNDEAYIYFQGLSAVTTLSITSGSGALYVTTSQTSKVRVESDLPQLLPPQADGYVITVGEQRSFRYYTFVAATSEWLESGNFQSPIALRNMPVQLVNTAGTWSIVQEDYEGRVAGDDDNNPVPEFLKRGLTGMSSYMNRLVLLSGNMVYMSSSTNAKRFMRSTVSGIVDSDPIGVGSSANSSAEYRYAVQFQKDLLLFSEKYQALIPSNGQAITPRTATVVVTSSYAGDVGSEPVPIGRTLLFPAPRSQDFFGFMEMISSQYSEAQYVSNDATAHIPKYMAGNCRFGVSSTTSNIVVFGSTGDRNALVVYEYLWDGEQKVQQAWHTWRFAYPVASAYFSQGVLHILFLRNGLLVCCAVDPKQSTLSGTGVRRPFIDLYTEVQVTDSIGNTPAWLQQFDPAAAKVATIATGDLAGDELGIVSSTPTTFTVRRGFDSGLVCLGVRYRQTFSPTSPTYLDQNGIKIDSAKCTLLRFGVMTQNSSEYQVQVTDSLSEDPEERLQATLFYSSTELEPGRATWASESRAVVPARTNANTTSLVLTTDGTGELNLTGIDFVWRLNRKLRRR